MLLFAAMVPILVACGPAACTLSLPSPAQQPTTHVDSFLENLVVRFSAEGFRFMFHMDPPSPSSFFRYFPRGVEASRLVVSHPEGVAEVRRPIGYQFIHVVLLQKPSGFLSYVAGRASVRPPDRALFVVSREALAEEEALGAGAFWRRGPGGGSNRIHRFGSTAFAVPSVRGLALYDVCHFCGLLSGVLRRTGTWDASRHSSTFARLDVFPDNWRDLRGHELRVLFLPFPPIIWCRQMAEVMPSSVGGYRERVCVGGASGPEGNLLDVASRSINFTVRLVDFSSTKEGATPLSSAAVTSSSSSTNTSLWDAMIGVLSSTAGPRGQSDLAVGDISITAARTRQVYFTRVFNREPHTFAFMRAEGTAPGVAGPFSPPLWVCLTAAWVTTSLLLGAIHASCRLLPEVLLSTGAMLLGQGASATPVALRASRPARPLLLCWCWLCFVLTSLYESKLVSSLITLESPEEPSTLEDLLVNRYELLTPRSSLFAVRGLLNSSDPVYRAAGNRMRVMETVEDCVGRLVESSRPTNKGPKVALIAEHSFLRWGLPRVIPEGEPGMSSSLRLGSAEILAYGQSWALRRDAMALAPALSVALAYASASGLPRHWLDRTLKSGRLAVGQGRPRRAAGKGMALPLQLFSASLFSSIWAGGLAAATAALLAEVVVARRQRWSSATNTRAPPRSS